MSPSPLQQGLLEGHYAEEGVPKGGGPISASPDSSSTQQGRDFHCDLTKSPIDGAKPEVTEVQEGRCPLAAFKVPDSFRKHPGGQQLLQSARESNSGGLMFLTYHMGLDLDGIIAKSANIYGVQVPETGPLFDEIQAMVRRVRDEQKTQRYLFQLWCMVITVLMPVFYVSAVTTMGPLSTLGACLSFELYFLNVFHTRHHKGGNLYEWSALNSVLNPIYYAIDNIWGYYPPAWRRNHHINHHMHTNDDDIDPDLPATYPLVRLFDSQERLWFHKFQTLYWPMLLPFSVARFPVSNLLEHGGNPVFFAAWLALMFVLPSCLHGWIAGVTWSLVMQGIVGVSLTYKFAISHAHVDNAESPSEEKKKKEVREMKADEFVMEQIEESSSWGGYWMCFIFGGINMQIEHHIAPALEPTLYACIQPELRAICDKHNIRYIAEPTLFHAMAKFHLRLWMSG